MTYDSYEAAKIANPESEIYASKIAVNGTVEIFGVFEVIANFTSNYYECDPSKYCMTVEKFLADGYKFVEGDLIYNTPFNRVDSVDNEFDVRTFAHKDIDDNKRYILRAEALKQRDNDYAMSVMEKKVKVDYIAVDPNKEEGKYWECARDFAEGKFKFFTLVSEEWLEIVDNDDLLYRYKIKNLCRKIETEIDERQEFIDLFLKVSKECSGVGYREFAGFLFDRMPKGE